MGFSRPLLALERFYLAYHDFCPDFVLQFFFDGSGTFDLPRWRKAVEIASEANPGSRLVLKGQWMLSRWVDSGITPRVREVECRGWDGLSSEGAPAFMKETYDPWKGPTCEVILMHGDRMRVCFRGHHGIMDGRGMLFWAEDVFRVLRGEPPYGDVSRLTEYEVARCFQKKGRTPAPHEFIAPTGKPQVEARGVVWRLLRLPVLFKNLLGQIAVLLARSAWQYGDGKVRFAIPVDLRFRRQGLRSIGNLSNLIYLDVVPGMTAEDAARNIAWQIQERMDGMLYWADRFVRYVPLRLIKRTILDELEEKNATGRYRNSGILSNIGRFPLEYYHGGGFIPEYFWPIPPGQESVPIFVGIAYSDEDTTLIFSMPRTLAGGGRLDALVEHFRQGLIPS